MNDAQLRRGRRRGGRRRIHVAALDRQAGGQNEYRRADAGDDGQAANLALARRNHLVAEQHHHEEEEHHHGAGIHGHLHQRQEGRIQHQEEQRQGGHDVDQTEGGIDGVAQEQHADRRGHRRAAYEQKEPEVQVRHVPAAIRNEPCSMKDVRSTTVRPTPK